MCGGSTSVSFPGPTSQEQELEQAQLDSLTQQKNMIEGFTPFVLQQYGLQSKDNSTQIDPLKAQVKSLQDEMDSWGPQGADNPYVMDHTKKIADLNSQIDGLKNQYEYTPDEIARQASLKTAQTQALQLTSAMNQRVQDAINGKIGPSEALTNQENQDFAALKEDQGRLGNEIVGDDLTNATSKSTSGIQALEALRKTYGSLKSQELNNIIAGGPGAAAQYTSNYRSAGSTSASQAEGGLLAPLAGLNGQYGAAYQPYQFQQSGQFQADSANAANNQSFYNTLLTGLIGGASKIGAAAIMA